MSSDERDEQNNREDEFLDALISQIEDDDQIDFRTLNLDEVIVDYLDGTATDQQKEHIRELMARSRGFRRMVAEIAAGIDGSALEADKSESPTPLADMLRLRNIMAKRRSKAPIYSLVAAAAVIVLMFIGVNSIFFAERDKPSPVYAELDRVGQYNKLEFGPITTRREIPDEKITSEIAAYKAFLERILYDLKPDELKFIEGDSVRSEMIEGKYITVSIQDENKDLLYEYTADLKIAYDSLKPEQVMGWILQVPSLELWRFDVPASEFNIIWDAAFDTVGCITITYPADGEYIYTPARLFNVNRD